MEAQSGRSDDIAAAASIRLQTANNSGDDVADPSSPSVDYDSDPDSNDEDEFDEAQCLFCNQTSLDLVQNLVHMLKVHGLYVDPAHLVVDVGTLLAYFHLIIYGRYECLYCRTQRNTREAVQQHMMDKGHCKYDEAELRDLFDMPSPHAKEELQRYLHAPRSDGPRPPSQARSRKPRHLKRSDRHGPDDTDDPLDHILSATTSWSSIDAESSSSAAETPSHHSWSELSTRALKQECALNNHLAQLRAGDRRSLLHLPTSQQRALLATRHKQMEKAMRTEQTNQSNLGSAGNKFNCLDKIRLIRKPPHTGNIHSLKR
ncbi:uncharacterized protein Z520_04116 [Fonsecaea multimorphosa CBS 102226]|uniref:ZN622/Rei1/Reh1 zinc finger C2H2-type domain-containing protein n=1 Tax=Fonsecaea multimorphosa CBS 102226 TaxID=1442371 RepID=A0A0D2HEY9_9EURO|nr:uncharacterized protein Z520_04116 [Fonsecaea multimorphosa CBS 102226]KIY00431.1 hypothetical protein Z520_04116 [Fonsecaea multimorphosa CBS 102226]